MITIMLDAGALSKLIEQGGPEFTLKLSQAVLSEASRRYVKAHADDAISAAAMAEVQAFMPSIRQSADDAVRRVFGFTDSSMRGIFTGAKFKPSPEMLEAVRKVAREAVEAAAKDALSEARTFATTLVDEKMAGILPSIQNRVNAAFDNGIKEEVERRVAEKMAAIAAAAAG